jgi:hypothetical protein
MPSIFIRDKPILSLERMLHKTMTARVQLQKKINKICGGDLKGLGGKMK